MAANDYCQVYVGNLSEDVSEDLLYELFLQAGPVKSVNIPVNQGKQKPFGFVHFKHRSSVPYSIRLMEGISLFGKKLRIAPPKGVNFGAPQSMCPPAYPPFQSFMDPSPIRNRPEFSRNQPSDFRRQPQRAHDLGNRGSFDQSGMMPSRQRHADYMMPSSRSKRRERSPSKKELDAIPDVLNSGFDLLQPYSFSEQDTNRHHSNRDRRRRDNGHMRDEPYEGKHGSGNKRSHYNRRDKHSPNTSNHRRHF